MLEYYDSIPKVRSNEHENIDLIPVIALYTVTGRILESIFIRNMRVCMHGVSHCLICLLNSLAVYRVRFKINSSI